MVGMAHEGYTSRARQHVSAALHRIDGVQNNETRILHPAIGIFEGELEIVLQRRAFRCLAEIDATAAGQLPAATEMIVEEKTQAKKPGGPLLGRMRQDEAHRPNDMRCCAQQNLALDERFAHQTELVIFEIAQAAVNELAGSRRRPFGEISLLAHDYRETAARGIPGDAGHSLGLRVSHRRGCGL